jgi:hypothetical protein
MPKNHAENLSASAPPVVQNFHDAAAPSDSGFTKWFADDPTGEKRARDILSKRNHYNRSLKGMAGAVVLGFAKAETVARELMVSEEMVQMAAETYRLTVLAGENGESHAGQ